MKFQRTQGIILTESAGSVCRRQALQTVLQIIGAAQPAALKAKPTQFVDHSLLQTIERSGFVEKLYGGQRQ